ncbi:hypothetical protein BDB13_5054 [Rhodococcus sp. OK302]|nr:hypothetical protein BDB13_5054 [Rhodococcus sp. OK302]
MTNGNAGKGNAAPASIDVHWKACEGPVTNQFRMRQALNSVWVDGHRPLQRLILGLHAGVHIASQPS